MTTRDSHIIPIFPMPALPSRVVAGWGVAFHVVRKEVRTMNRIKLSDNPTYPLQPQKLASSHAISTLLYPKRTQIASQYMLSEAGTRPGGNPFRPSNSPFLALNSHPSVVSHPHTLSHNQSLFLPGSVIDVTKGKIGNDHVSNRQKKRALEEPNRSFMAFKRPDCCNSGRSSQGQQALRSRFSHHSLDRSDKPSSGSSMVLGCRKTRNGQTRHGPMASCLRRSQCIN